VKSQARTAVLECVVLAVACLITYELVTNVLSRVYSGSRDDDLLGGMWAVISTIFVLRGSFGKSMAAAVSRMAATSVSFALCLIYLAFLPFHAWALAVLAGASALAAMLLGRPGDAVTAAITTTVIMVVAAVSPQHAWQQPILRLADTIVGVVVGALAAWTGMQVQRFLPVLSHPAKVKSDLPERAVVRRPRTGRPHVAARQAPDYRQPCERTGSRRRCGPGRRREGGP
jgi:Fusaric acid resistance protein-like